MLLFKIRVAVSKMMPFLVQWFVMTHTIATNIKSASRGFFLCFYSAKVLFSLTGHGDVTNKTLNHYGIFVPSNIDLTFTLFLANQNKVKTWLHVLLPVLLAIKFYISQSQKVDLINSKLYCINLNGSNSILIMEFLAYYLSSSYYYEDK